MTDYQWDVFISYRRETLVRDWTTKIFAPKLKDWLPHHQQPAPQVFLDVDHGALPIGGAWPANIRDALHRSRCMLAILSPDYWNSAWCVAEWDTMVRRQGLTGHGCVYPVQFSDGQFYRGDAAGLLQDRFEDFNSVRRPGQIGKAFTDRIKTVCTGLAARISGAPKWDAGWPIIELPPPPPEPIPRPGY